MKKLLPVLALLLTLAAPVHAFALDLAALDLFSSMSVSDLLRARNVLSEELMKRGYSEYTLSKGKHTVGEAIKPGTYTIAAPNLLYSTLLVYSADGALVNMRSLDYNWRYHESVERNGRIQIELSEGQVLHILSDPMTFYKY